MTAATTLRPTSGGTVRFAAFYASMIAIPLGLTWLVVEGPSAALIGIAAGYLIAGLGFAALVKAGWYHLRLTEQGLQTRALGRSSVLAWAKIDRIETGRFLGQEIWVRVHGYPDERGRSPALAVLPAFLFGMKPAELRDLLAAHRATGGAPP